MTDFGLRGENIVCFAGEDWWYHHPHSKNFILQRLAKHNTVLFVNSITMGLPSRSNPDFWLKIRRKAKSYLRWLRRAPEGLWVISPLVLPFFGSRLMRRMNRVLLAAQMKLAMMICGMRKPAVLWVANPVAAGAVELLKPKVVLYQVSDKYDANQDSALPAEVIRGFHGRMIERADVVLYSGRKLFQEATEPHRYFLEQAVDFDRCANLPAGAAAEIAAIPHPVLGYVGWIDYVMDCELIQEVARRRPEWQWVFIGTKTNTVQVDAPNVHFLGPKPYAELPKYQTHVDVWTLPWSQRDSFTSYGSAIKVKEYLATGKPVVISPLYEYLDTPGVRIYRTADEFIARVEDALANDTPEQRRARQDAVRDATWDQRTREVAALIRQVQAGKRYRVEEHAVDKVHAAAPTA